MNPLGSEEQRNLIRRRDGFGQFVQEILPVLEEFLQLIGASNPADVASHAETFLPAVDSWMSNQTVGDEDRIWVLTRLGYFFGTLLCQKFGGRWLLDEDPTSPYFLQYVVGDFSKLPIAKSEVAPFAVANNYVNTPPPRSLIGALARVEDGLRRIIDTEQNRNA